MPVLAIAYYNRGVEHEHLGSMKDAFGCYVQGVRWARRFVRGDHGGFVVAGVSLDVVHVVLYGHSYLEPSHQITEFLDS